MTTCDIMKKTLSPFSSNWSVCACLLVLISACDTPIAVQETCGDQLADPGEECDGDDLGGLDCALLGYPGGTLRCQSNCRLDPTGCADYGRCGNGLVEETEQCDGEPGEGTDCLTLGYYAGTLACGETCMLDATSCKFYGRCGDGQVQRVFGEECDGGNLDGVTCRTLGFHSDLTPLCTRGCLLDLSPCEDVGRCGDGVLQEDDGEQCDGTLTAEQTCAALGYHGGTLACDGECLFDLSGCAAVGRCGDGVVQAVHGEVCDLEAFNQQTCRTRGYYGGVLRCSSSCLLDESGCGNLIDLSAGPRFTCGVLTSGSVFCWGTDESQELGDGNANTLATLTPISGLTGVLSVTSGGSHSCALLIDGTVRCWGCRNDGQLGDDVIEESSDPGPNAVLHLTDVVQLVAGDAFTCARRQDGSVWCWGADSSGELGNGYSDGYSVPSPVPVEGITTAVDLDAQGNRACVVLVDGRVSCWGNYEGVPVPMGALTGVSRIVLGGGHACALMQDQSVRCWGGNYKGQLGNGSRTDSAEPVTVTGLFDVLELVAGPESTCALSSDGVVRCWGASYETGFDLDRFVPTPVTGLTGMSDLEGTPYCARHPDGHHSCWGYSALTDLPTLPPSSRLEVEEGTLCVVLPDTTVQCWGANNCSKAGAPNLSFQTRPVPVQGAEPATRLDVPCEGWAESCAVTNSGTIQCWGDQASLMEGITDAVSVSSGAYHSCALKADGSVWCWGENSSGQLGNGTTTSSIITPVLVSGLTQATGITAGWYHSCAVLQGGALYCWGKNDYRQLGDGSTINRSLPVAVTGLSAVSEAAPGRYFTCAIRTDGTVWCWGANWRGQLGNGTTTSSGTPVQAGGISSAISLSAGESHACAVLANGTVRCWGDNGEGCLGIGTVDGIVENPTAVTNLSGARRVTAGSSHTCALLTTGRARCWGSNYWGQLGDGTIEGKATPVEVRFE